MNKDKLHQIVPRQASIAAYTGISAMQHLPAHEQMSGAMVLAVVLAEASGMGISEFVNQAQRIVKDADTYYTTEIRSLRAYVESEIVKK